MKIIDPPRGIEALCELAEQIVSEHTSAYIDIPISPRADNLFRWIKSAPWTLLSRKRRRKQLRRRKRHLRKPPSSPGPTASSKSATSATTPTPPPG